MFLYRSGSLSYYLLVFVSLRNIVKYFELLGPTVGTGTPTRIVFKFLEGRTDRGATVISVFICNNHLLSLASQQLPGKHDKLEKLLNVALNQIFKQIIVGKKVIPKN